jgi:hypothetical protein
MSLLGFSVKVTNIKLFNAQILFSDRVSGFILKWTLALTIMFDL